MNLAFHAGIVAFIVSLAAVIWDARSKALFPWRVSAIALGVFIGLNVAACGMDNASEGNGGVYAQGLTRTGENAVYSFFGHWHTLTTGQVKSGDFHTDAAGDYFEVGGMTLTAPPQSQAVMKLRTLFNDGKTYEISIREVRK